MGLFRRTKRIFLVDDHELFRETLAAFLGAQDDLELCGTAASGEEALGKIHPGSCDLVLVDVSMPGMNGIELVTRLRAVQPALACLMLSGHTDARYMARARDAGACGYIGKGDPDAIVPAIWNVLDRPSTNGDRPRDALA